MVCMQRRGGSIFSHPHVDVCPVSTHGSPHQKASDFLAMLNYPLVVCAIAMENH